MTIEVIAGVIVRDGRLLLCQRPKCGTWCSPGAKLEPGESLEEALRRELMEDLGVHACDVESGVIAECTVGDYHVTFLPVSVRGPRPLAFIGLGWFRPVDMRALHAVEALTPANAACVEHIVAYMKGLS